jgi:hypothetical protein
MMTENGYGPIEFRRDGGVITLSMSEENYGRLLLAFGYIAGFGRALPGESFYWRVMKLINDLNAGNPHFTPYKIPRESNKQQQKEKK